MLNIGISQDTKSMFNSKINTQRYPLLNEDILDKIKPKMRYDLLKKDTQKKLTTHLLFNCTSSEYLILSKFIHIYLNEEYYMNFRLLDELRSDITLFRYFIHLPNIHKWYSIISTQEISTYDDLNTIRRAFFLSPHDILLQDNHLSTYERYDIYLRSFQYLNANKDQAEYLLNLFNNPKSFDLLKMFNYFWHDIVNQHLKSMAEITGINSVYQDFITKFNEHKITTNIKEICNIWSKHMKCESLFILVSDFYLNNRLMNEDRKLLFKYLLNSIKQSGNIIKYDESIKSFIFKRFNDLDANICDAFYRGVKLYKLRSIKDQRLSENCNSGVNINEVNNTCIICLNERRELYRICPGKQTGDKRTGINCGAYGCLECWKSFIDTKPFEGYIECIVCRRRIEIDSDLSISPISLNIILNPYISSTVKNVTDFMQTIFDIAVSYRDYHICKLQQINSLVKCAT